MVWAAEGPVRDPMRHHRLPTTHSLPQMPQRQRSQPRLPRHCSPMTHNRDDPPVRFHYRRYCHVVAGVAGAEEVQPAGAARLAEREADRAGR